MKAIETVAIVGAGSLGRVLALALHNAGFRVTEIITRDDPASIRKALSLAKRVGARGANFRDARFDAKVIWICVPDDTIAEAAREMANLPSAWQGKIVLHASGALPSSELMPLKKRAAAIGSLHPMNTFVAKSKPDLLGTPFAVEGDPVAVRAARWVASKLTGGAEVFTIKPEDKVLYHAVGSFSSPLLVSLLSAAEQLAKAAGIEKPSKLMRKIVLQTVDNYFRDGADAAFSGPIRRGDVATVQKHLSALKNLPRAKQIYKALAENAVENLNARNQKELLKVLRSANR